MSFDPNLHHRRSIRLKGYDYSSPAWYYLTICCQNRMPCFGKIVSGEMALNDAGKMVNKWYWELERKFPDVLCHEHVVMPDHFHALIEILPGHPSVGADLRVCPEKEIDPGVCPKIESGDSHIPPGEHTASCLSPEHTASPLPRVVQWFKTMTTNAYIRGVKHHRWKAFDRRLWQRNYYEHIVRDPAALERIQAYIQDNPRNWKPRPFF